MLVQLQSSFKETKTPKIIKFGADVAECLALQARWHIVEKCGPLQVAGHIRRYLGVKKATAYKLGGAYERFIYNKLSFMRGVCRPRNGLYGPKDKLGEVIQRLRVHHFLPPEDLVRAAFIVARQGSMKEVSGCLCHSTELLPSGATRAHRIVVSFAESIEQGLLMGASIHEVYDDKRRTRVVHSVFNGKVAHSRFDGIGGDTCMRVLDAAKRVGSKHDARAWTGYYASRFGFA